MTNTILEDLYRYNHWANCKILELCDGLSDAELDQFVAAQNDESVSLILLASFGGPAFQVPLVESKVQLCGHGTHHRAQLVNMLRHSKHTPPAIDYVVWVGEQ